MAERFDDGGRLGRGRGCRWICRCLVANGSLVDWLVGWLGIVGESRVGVVVDSCCYLIVGWLVGRLVGCCQ